jgi:two-component system, NarL family, sensor histidine kinase DevS
VSEDVRELIDRAVFEERDRIARDLHDLVIQRLFAIGLGMQAMTRKLGAPEEELRGFVGELDQTIRDIRTSIFCLQQRPRTVPSLRAEILREISDASLALGFEPTVRLEGPLDSVVPPEVHLDLIATVREALSNVVRHALAERVWVTVLIDKTGDRLELLVKDDGIGLRDARARRSGLSNIRRRALRHGGRARAYSPQDGGTRVYWAVPLRAPMRFAEAGPVAVEAS